MPDLAKPKVDLIISGAAEVLTCVSTRGDLLGRRTGVAVAITGEHIAQVGPVSDIAEQFDMSHTQQLEARGKIVAPGFVDSHTHLVFGGSRAWEFGAGMTRTAKEVAALGFPTGIQATVAMTRAAKADALLFDAGSRVEQIFRHGTTTVESKSGYGLTVEKEIELLRINRLLAARHPVDIVSTFLGAHDFPQELSREAYLDSLIHEMLPQVAAEKLAEFCDVYCDTGYYSVDEARRILEAGLAAGLRPKLHVDAYSNIGGSALAEELKVVSADHLNFTTPAEMRNYAALGITGVVMPGLDFAVRHPKPFEARRMLAEGMSLALATDLCAGCWLASIQLVIQLACRLYQFSPEEALLAATVGGAKALGLDHDRGSIAQGKLADLQIWNIPTFEDLVYRIGNNAVETVIKKGIIYRVSEDTAHDRADRRCLDD